MYSPKIEEKRRLKNQYIGSPRREAWRKYQWRQQGIAMTIEEYDKLLSHQKNKCGICGRHQLEFNKRLAVDHDHKTGRIRGLLCSRCNRFIGTIENNIQRLVDCKKYLKLKEWKDAI